MSYTIIHILKFIVVSIVLTLSFFVFTSSKAHAYFTTNQSAINVGSHTGLYLIEYTFGVEKYEVHMPLMARNSVKKNVDSVSYVMLDKHGKEVTGKTTSIVLSDTPLKGTMYVTPKGVAKKFTLVVFFTPDSPSTDSMYRLLVTHLPFNFGGTQQLQLNPSELQYYTTKFIKI